MLIANSTKPRIDISYFNVVHPTGLRVQVVASIQCAINAIDTNLGAQANEIKSFEQGRHRCAKNLHQRQSEALVANRRQLLHFLLNSVRMSECIADGDGINIGRQVVTLTAVQVAALKT